MFKHVLGAFLLFSVTCGLQAQNNRLKYNQDGRFKIVQFTDLHIKQKDARSDIAFERIDQVLKEERPDLVIITGDMIYNKPADENLRNLLQVFEKREQPFAVTFGNHDQEQGMSNEELFNVVKSFKYNLTENEPGITGTGNCTLEIKASDSDKTAHVLYLFDSGRTSNLPDAKGYAFIGFDQVGWYRNKSNAYKEQYGKSVPALAFFHIPLPEFAYAIADNNASSYGIRRENPCPPVLNSGLFASMKEMGDVKGIFVGHDHDNDYAVNWKGILLAYGRFTGGPTEYIHIPNGARVIELTENEPGLKTWIRTATGTEQITEFPEDYVK